MGSYEITSDDCILEKTPTDPASGRRLLRGIVDSFGPTEIGQQIIVGCPVEGCGAEVELILPDPNRTEAQLTFGSLCAAEFICKRMRT